MRRASVSWTLAGLVALLLGQFGQAGEVDALGISANIQARHMPFGGIVDPVFASPESDQIVGYSRCGDSAIWTGHYLAAEAFRYKVTKSADALNIVRRTLAAIKGLLDVTGTNLLARCMVQISSPYAAGIRSEEAGNGIFTNDSAGWIWVGNTSRDQYSGVMFGLAVAFDMVDDPEIKSSISGIVTRLIDFLRGHNWTVVMPNGDISTVFLARPDQMLAFLQVGRHVNPDHYSTLYDLQRILLLPGVLAPTVGDVASDDSYFKFNLNYINLYNLVRMESSSFRGPYEQVYDILRNHTSGHQNAFFNIIDRALKGPNAARDAEMLALLEGWLLRPRRDRGVDLRNALRVCGSQACEPVPIAMRPPTDFLWQRNPFQLVGGGDGYIEPAGIDYVLPYWMARYYGLDVAFRVQSAAASSTTVAPDSLASMFGANLAASTDRATTLPLPTSLAGVNALVKDSAGVERSAPLIYVSPGQINFIVPAGTAPGVATFSIANGAATVTAPARVQNTAPALFSMNGTGIGVAAATAIRTQVANPQLQTPVPVFECDHAGCVAMPIDLGLDTPIFLTLYGTGIRNRSNLDGVKVTIHGVSVPVMFAGPQPDFLGLDQVNVALPLELRGSGQSEVVLTMDGQASNAVTINVR